MPDEMEAGASQIEILPLHPEPKPAGPHWELLETLAPGSARGAARSDPR